MEDDLIVPMCLFPIWSTQDHVCSLMILNCVLTVHCSLCLQPPYPPTQSHSCIWIESHFDYSFIHYPLCGLSIAITKSQVPHPFCLVSGYSGMQGDFDSSPRRAYRKEGPCENKSSTHTQIPNIIIVEFHVAGGTSDVLHG